MTNREFYQSISICPVCHKEKLYGDEKECLECRATKYVQLRDWRRKHPNSYAEQRKEKYFARVNNHLCIQCGISLPETETRVMCCKCRIKHNLNQQRRRAING